MRHFYISFPRYFTGFLSNNGGAPLRRLDFHIIIFFLSAAALYFIAIPPAAVAGNCPEYIWISFGEESFRKNGTAVMRYHIRLNDDALKSRLTNLDFKAFYRLGGRRNRTYLDIGFYRADITQDGDDCYFEVESRSGVRVELLVTGKCGCKQFAARALHALYGISSETLERIAARKDDIPENLPALQLMPSNRRSYMQTGIPYHFYYDGINRTADVVENHKRVETLSMDSAGKFSYTPPHDPRLDKDGHYAYKEIVLLVDESTPEGDYAVTHTLVLHRTIHGYLDLKAGLILFAVTILAAITPTLYKRRRANF